LQNNTVLTAAYNQQRAFVFIYARAVELIFQPLIGYENSLPFFKSGIIFGKARDKLRN